MENNTGRITEGKLVTFWVVECLTNKNCVNKDSGLWALSSRESVEGLHAS